MTLLLRNHTCLSVLSRRNSCSVSHCSPGTPQAMSRIDASLKVVPACLSALLAWNICCVLMFPIKFDLNRHIFLRSRVRRTLPYYTIIERRIRRGTARTCFISRGGDCVFIKNVRFRRNNNSSYAGAVTGSELLKSQCCSKFAPVSSFSRDDLYFGRLNS